MEKSQIPQDIQDAANKWLDGLADRVGTVPWEAEEGYIAGACKEREQTQQVSLDWYKEQKRATELEMQVEELKAYSWKNDYEQSQKELQQWKEMSLMLASNLTNTLPSLNGMSGTYKDAMNALEQYHKIAI